MTKTAAGDAIPPAAVIGFTRLALAVPATTTELGDATPPYTVVDVPNKEHITGLIVTTVAGDATLHAAVIDFTGSVTAVLAATTVLGYATPPKTIVDVPN